MTWLKLGYRRLRALLGRDRLEREMDDEMRFHVELEAEELMRREGLPEREARRRALVAFGGVEQAKERARAVRRVRWLDDLARDVRHGLRSMRKSPGFATVAGVTLALGIGATTAIFSVVDGVLLKPLPYPDSDRLVSVWSRFLPESGMDFPTFPISPPEYSDYREQSRAVEDVAAYYGFGATLLRDDGRPIRVRGASASANLFDVLGVRPAVGRTYTAEEDVPNGPSVVVLGHGLWRRAYGGDPDVVGRTIRIDGGPAEVVGVMPEGFAFPNRRTELWTPAGFDPAATNRGSHYLVGIARLAPDVSLERAGSEMTAMMDRWEAEYPDVHTGHFLFLRPFLDDVVGGARATLRVLLGAVGFVLLIVCANVANLLLARGESRRRDLAVRTALGAGRGRLMRQFLAEGAVLSLIGGAAGFGLAHLAVDAVLALGEDSIPRAASVAVDGRVLLFTAAVAVFTTLVFAVAPAARASVADPRRAMGDAGRSTSAGAGGLRLRNGLVVAQVALAVVVVIGAGLMVRSFRSLVRIDPGFRADRVLVADLSLPSGDYPEPVGVRRFYDGLRERMGALPGVRSTAAVSALPLSDRAPTIDFVIEGRPPPAEGEPSWGGDALVATPGYLETMGIGLVRGRFFRDADHEDAPLVAVVNETLARTFWPDGDPVGQRFRMAAPEDSPWLTVVGVIEDVRNRSLTAEPRPAWYLPMAQMHRTFGSPARSYSVVMRTDGEPMAHAPAVRSAVRALDPVLPVNALRPLAAVVAESVAGPRFTTTVLGVFAALALVLGAVGLYGIVSYTVARRTRELGIRIALGAGGRELARLVVGQGLRLVLIGLVLGLATAFGATRLMQGLLFGVSPTDPATFAAVGATVCLFALAACAVPVRRALRADPMRALRMD